MGGQAMGDRDMGGRQAMGARGMEDLDMGARDMGDTAHAMEAGGMMISRRSGMRRRWMLMRGLIMVEGEGGGESTIEEVGMMGQGDGGRRRRKRHRSMTGPL